MPDIGERAFEDAIVNVLVSGFPDGLSSDRGALALAQDAI